MTSTCGGGRGQGARVPACAMNMIRHVIAYTMYVCAYYIYIYIHMHVCVYIYIYIMYMYVLLEK